ncbi:hypothetical protein D3C76_541530 [compost metagenome]
MPVGRDINRVHAGFGVVDRQAVGAAEHHTHCRIGACAERTGLARQAFGVGGEVAQTEKTAFQFTLAIELMHRVISLVVRTAKTRQLHVEGLGPVAQAAAGLQTVTTAQILILAAVEIELVTHHQATAAAFRLLVITLGFAVALGIFGDDRQQ